MRQIEFVHYLMGCKEHTTLLLWYSCQKYSCHDWYVIMKTHQTNSN